MEYDENAKFFLSEDEDQDLWLLFTHSRYAVYRAREKELQKFGTSPEQVSLLFAVRALGKRATPASISRQLLLQPHSVSTLINRMARSGLVNKVKDLDRKNQVRVVITKKGKKICELSAKRGPIHRIMGVLNAEEKKALRSFMEVILAKARKEIGLDQEEFPPSDI